MSLSASAFLATVLASNLSGSTPLDTLPDGNYYYEATYPAAAAKKRLLLLQKTANTVTGIEMGFLIYPCFQGTLEENTVVETTWIFPPYTTEARQDFRQGVTYDLNRYRSLDRDLREEERTALDTCLGSFE